MSGESKGLRGRSWVELPTAPQVVSVGGSNVTTGGGYIVTLTGSTAAVIDLSTIDYQGPVGALDGDPQMSGSGASDVYITIRVVGIVPVYIAGYPTLAAYTAVKPTIAGTLGANPAGFSWPVFPIATTGPAVNVDADRYLVRKGVNHFLGMISSGTPTVYIYRSGSFENSR